MIFENRIGSESYFLFNERILGEKIIFRCLYCVEFGQILEDDYTLQNWLGKQESVLHDFNENLRGKSIKYYSNLKKFKFDLVNIEGFVHEKVENLKKFRIDMEIFRSKIETQKKSLLRFKGNLTNHEKFSSLIFNYEGMQKLILNNSLFNEQNIHRAEELEMKKRNQYWEDIKLNHFFKGLDNINEFDSQK
jgi:hypothetical protein